MKMLCLNVVEKLARNLLILLAAVIFMAMAISSLRNLLLPIKAEIHLPCMTLLWMFRWLIFYKKNGEIILWKRQ